jgi:FkbM family methyltransferase
VFESSAGFEAASKIFCFVLCNDDNCDIIKYRHIDEGLATRLVLMVTQIVKSVTAPAVFRAEEETWLLNQFFADTKHGIFIDIGANEPESAVSLELFKRGWRGLVVDPIPSNATKLEAAGFDVWCGAVTTEEMAKAGETKFHVAGGERGRKSSLDAELIDPLLEITEIVVPLITLQNLIAKMDVESIQLLAIDVEGCERDVLSTLPNGFHIDLILVEDWARNTLLHQDLVSRGYRRVRRTGYNSWYVPSNSDFRVSLLGKLHLTAKLNWFAPIRQRRFDRKRVRAQLGSV